MRGFTSFAEGRPPSEVVDFLNRIIGLQVEIIEAHGGDVDKMIGDAVRSSGLARGIGIGVFTGPVMMGLISSGNRFDYTVVVDSVNIAARLCAAAREGEIVVDADTAVLAPKPGFGPQETLRVKGRAGALMVRRLAIDATFPAEANGGHGQRIRHKAFD